MKKLKSFSALLGVLCISAFISSASAQTTSTYYTNSLAVAINCQHTTTNLSGTQNYTNLIWQGRHIGVGVAFGGQTATNTGTIGFQFAVKSKGVNGTVTTTRPFTITSTANGTTGVTDWSVIPNYNLGPADALVLVGITNAAVNVNAGFSTGGVIVSNVWLQYDTRP